MTQETELQSPEAAAATTKNRKQPLLLGNVMSMKKEKKIMMDRDIGQRNRIGEVAGGTAAECAAVCCCCPCTVAHLVVMAVYTVPTGLLKKALKKTKKRLLGKKRKNKISSSSEKKNQWTAISQNVENTTSDESDGDKDTTSLELDSEMWDRFHGAGFWRSSSQREE